MNPEHTALEPNSSAISKTSWPEWIWTTDLNDLPEALQWDSGQWPPYSSYVEVVRHGEYLASGTVTNYFHAAGNLFVVITVEHVIERLKLIPGDVLIALYDDDFVIFVDEDDDPIYPLMVAPSYEERRAPYHTEVAQSQQKDARSHDGNEECTLPF